MPDPFSSPETERSLLGAFLLDPATFHKCDDITVDHFSLSSHRMIYAAMARLFENQVDVDLATLADSLREVGELDKVGGYSYIAGLTDGTVVGNLKYKVQILTEKRQRRELDHLSKRMQALAEDTSIDPGKTLSDLQSKAFQIASESRPKEEDIFLGAQDFMEIAKGDIQWRVDKIIEKGTNGFILATPKTGKSFVTTLLAVCLATGYQFFDLDVAQCRVALVNREDYAGTTARRLRRLLAGMGLENTPLNRRLWVNSRAQSQRLMLDNPRELNNLILNLKRRDIEFLILDVLNVLHDQDENSNTEMRGVLKRVEQIRNEVGCQICLVHHASKSWEDGMSLSQIARGASAIAGFAEFLIGIRMVDEDEQVRHMRFDTKAAEPLRSFHWKIHDNHIANGVTLDRTQYEPKEPRRRAAKSV